MRTRQFRMVTGRRITIDLNCVMAVSEEVTQPVENVDGEIEPPLPITLIHLNPGGSGAYIGVIDDYDYVLDLWLAL